MTARTTQEDPGTIEALCLACPHGPSPSKFKKDCAHEGERPADLRDLSRVMFAWLWMQREGGQIAAYLDADLRTVHKLFARGGLTWLLDRPDASFEEILDSQRFARTTSVVMAIRRVWLTS